MRMRAQIRILDCCSNMPFHLWPLRSMARCHDNGLYHFFTARCDDNGPYCTILHAILLSKCMRDVMEHVGTYGTKSLSSRRTSWRFSRCHVVLLKILCFCDRVSKWAIQTLAARQTTKGAARKSNAYTRTRQFNWSWSSKSNWRADVYLVLHGVGDQWTWREWSECFKCGK